MGVMVDGCLCVSVRNELIFFSYAPLGLYFFTFCRLCLWVLNARRLTEKEKKLTSGEEHDSERSGDQNYQFSSGRSRKDLNNKGVIGLSKK
ncbi:hypothetical protein RUM44_000278 [Polyplax serrata]|uniref:Uncharacterized protein n=1 Tax=Polyplax serrata TaxID=468196 RepID=A0ABR1B512_POLSC